MALLDDSGDAVRVIPVSGPPGVSVTGPAGATGATGPAGSGAAGPIGPPGPGTMLARMAAAPILNNCYVVSAGGQTCVPADITNAAHCSLGLGFVAIGVGAGQYATVQTIGDADIAGLSLTAGKPIYPGLGGVITNTRPDPANGATWIQALGQSATASSIVIGLGPARRFLA